MKKFILLVCLILSMSLLTGCIKVSFNIDDETTKNNISDVEKELSNMFENLDDGSDAPIENNTNKTSDDESSIGSNDISETENSLSEIFKNLDDGPDAPIEDDANKESQTSNSYDQNSKSFADSARLGDYNNPIKLNEAGIISAYNSENTSKEADLYLRVKEVFSGQKAKNLADEYNETAYIRYDIDDKAEWHAAVIEIDFKDFPISKYGRTAKQLIPTYTVVETDGSSLNLNGYSYFMMPELKYGPVDESNKTAFQGDVIEFYIIYALPKGYNKDYVLAFEHADYETKTCFLIEN